MKLYDELDDTSRGFVGAGGQLNIWNEDLQAYVLFIPTETLPSVVGSTNTVEHDVTTSNAIGKIKGKKTIDDKDLQFLWHRDNLIRLDEYLGEQCKFLVSYKDGTGWKFTSEYTYKPDDANSSDKVTGTISLITSNVDDTACLDAFSLMKQTAFITSLLDSELDLETSKSKSYNLTSNIEGVTYEATSTSSDIATATISGAKLTIQGLANGICIIKIKATKDGVASWTNTIYVQVK